MSPALAFRLGAIGLATLAITVAARQARHRAPPPIPPPAAPVPARTDLARAELERCQVLGERGASDETCLRAWAQQRQRFLGLTQQEAR